MSFVSDLKAKLEAAFRPPPPPDDHSLGDLALGTLAAAGTHKGLDLGLNYVARRNPWTRKAFADYYSALALAGGESGLGRGPNILGDGLRRGIMGVLPVSSGLMDYETAQLLAQEHSNKLKSPASVWNEHMPHLSDDMRRHASKHVDDLSLKSPLTRNMLNSPTSRTTKHYKALVNADSAARKTGIPLPRRGGAALAALGSMGLGSGLHAALHGDASWQTLGEGALGGLMSNGMELAAMGLGDMDALNTIKNVKSRILRGYADGTLNTYKPLMSVVSPASHELGNLGVDIGKVSPEALRRITHHADAPLLGPGGDLAKDWGIIKDKLSPGRVFGRLARRAI